jgi:hypothetical protein
VQDLIDRFGGYQNITQEAWTEFDRSPTGAPWVGQDCHPGAS